MVLKSIKFYGLRSFNHNEGESEFHEIKFDPKITIIKGRNGSGKTTVIECLVFGLTGKLSSSPEGLTSFINEADTGIVAEIIITLTKGEDTYQIAWIIQRPNKKLKATCDITCNGVPIHSGALSSEAAEIEIKRILNLPSGAIEKLLLVPQEDTFWPFGTATTLKQGIDKFLCLEDENKILQDLVEQRKSLQAKLEKETPLLKPAQEKSNFLTQAQNKNKVARDDQRRFSSIISTLEDEKIGLEDKLNKCKEVKELKVKLQHSEDIIAALKISEDEISNVNQASLDEDTHRLSNEILENNSEFVKETKLKKDLENQLREITTQYHDANTRATVKQENSQVAKLKFESLSQSFENLSQDSQDLVTDISLYIEQLEENKKKFEDEYQTLLTDRTENERRKACIETTLQEKAEIIAHKNANLAKLKDSLSECAIQDGKLSILDDKMPEFIERVEIHKRQMKETQLHNECLMELYESEFANVLEAMKKLGSAEGSLTTNEEVLKELKRFQSADLNTIIHQRMEKNKQLKQSVGALKQSLDEKRKSFASFKELLFEELRLELVTDLVKRYDEVVSKEPYAENGKPAKMAKLDDSLSGGLAFRKNEEINRIQQELRSLTNFQHDQEDDRQKLEQTGHEIGQSISHNRSNYQNLTTEIDSKKSNYKDLKGLKTEAENFSNSDEINVILDHYKTSMDQLGNTISQADTRIDAISSQQNDLKVKESRVNQLKEALSIISELKTAKNNFEVATASTSTLGLDAFVDIPNLESKLNQTNYNLKITSVNFAEIATKVSLSQKDIDKYPNALTDLATLQTKMLNLQNRINQTNRDEKEKRSQIIKKHQEMIDNINNYLKDWWEMIFQHDDIPTIFLEGDIKSEGDIRVDYTYHFKMRTCRNNGELRMRGRSSYGEKVLASFIIRCAFAEKFAGECPIVAFDEPEGCLDEGVVRNLVDHFSNITGSNQVIVTSYDEEFCQKLAAKCDDGYAIYRIDKENGSSTLTLDNSGAD